MALSAAPAFVTFLFHLRRPQRNIEEGGEAPRFLLGTCNVTPTPRWWFLLLFYFVAWSVFFCLARITFWGDWLRGRTVRTLDRCFDNNRLSESKIKLPNYDDEWSGGFLFSLFSSRYILIRNFCIISWRFLIVLLLFKV